MYMRSKTVIKTRTKNKCVNCLSITNAPCLQLLYDMDEANRVHVMSGTIIVVVMIITQIKVSSHLY